MRINDVVGQQVALLVQTYNLAARAEARVYGHHPLLAYRRVHQQLAQVVSENLDALDIGLFLGLPQDLSRDGGVQQALPSIVHRLPHLLMRRIAVFLAIIIIEFVAALLPVGINFHLQEAFFLGAQHGQKIMGRDFGNGLREVEITAVLGGLGIGLPLFGNLGAHAAGTVDPAQRLAVVGGFADPFGQDVPGALQRLFHGGHFPLHELGGIGLGVAGFVVPQQIGQRLQAFGYGHRGARLALGPIRKVKVFQLAAADAVLDGLLQFRGQFSLLLDGAQDGRLALFHLSEDIGPMLDLRHLDIRKAARAFLAVTADERDGAAFPEEFDAILHLPLLNVQQLGYIVQIQFFHGVIPRTEGVP